MCKRLQYGDGAVLELEYVAHAVREQVFYPPETPAAESVFIATGSVRAAEDESVFPAASGS